jgi:DNA-binding CsgD family transcriptional regulator
LERLSLADEITPGLIEREGLLVHAAAAVGEAGAGRGSVTLIQGTAGLGKSAALAAVRARAAGEGLEVLSGSGRRREQEFGLGVVLQLFERRIISADGPEGERLLADAANEAALLLDPAPDRPVPDSSFDIIHGLYRLCVHLSELRPLLISVDDADLADSASLEFLLYLAERVKELPIAMVLTAGSVPRRVMPQLLVELAQQRYTHRHRLDPLSLEGTVQLVRERSPAGASNEICHALNKAGAGNPLLIDEMCALLEPGDAAGPPGRVHELAPMTVAEWALTLAGDVDERAAALLTAAAVLGPDAELRHAAAIAGLETEPAACLVDELVEVGLLRAGPGLSFAHPVVSAALDSIQPAGQRATRHLRAAELLAEEDASPELVAAHVVEAPCAGNAWAVESLTAAAAVALGRGVPSEAVRYLRRALEEPPPRAMRAHVMLELGRAEATAGEPQAAVRLRDAVQHVQEAPEGARAALETGRALFALGKPFEAMGVFEHGLDHAADGDQDVSARLRAAHATSVWLTRPTEPLDHSHAPRTGESAGDRALLALHAMEAAVRGVSADLSIELATRALNRGALLDDETADGLTYYLAAGALAIAGDLQTAEAALTAAIEDARSRGSVLGFATASHMRAMAILMRGRVTDAAADARHALAVEHHGWRLGLGGARLVLANSLIESGDLDGARRHLKEAETAVNPNDPTRLALFSTRGRLSAVDGDHRAALADFLACGELGERSGVDNPAVAPWRSDAALSHAALGQISEAERLADVELRLAESFGAPGPIGRALRALGAIRGPERGLDSLEAAVDRLDSSQNALERSRALVELGAALRRAGRRREAREPLRHGLDLAKRCGALPLAERAMREAKVAGARPRRTAMYGIDSLTARERQTAALAAEGMSNREIAETLVVTVKTVEWHLKHSYQKLGVSSRAQLRDIFDANTG